MIYQVKFKDALVQSFGGFKVNIGGLIQSKKGGLAIFSGESGGGKSLLFSTLGWLHGFPGFSSVEKVVTDNIEMLTTPIQKVALVRQEPLDNFVGGTLCSEFRLVFGDSRYSRSCFKTELGRILSEEFEIDEDMLSRHPSTMSSGEQQLAAICLAIVSNADLILLDEPLARLSSKYAARVVGLLKQQQNQRHILASIHLNDNIHAANLLAESIFHSVELHDGFLKVSPCEQHDLDLGELKINLDNLETAPLFLSKESLREEREASSDFSTLPESSVRCIRGLGPDITSQPLDLRVYLGDEPLTSCLGFSLNQGINLIYGDNGAGKTLVARALSGEFSSKRGILRPKRIRLGDAIPDLKIGGSQDSLSFVSIRFLRKRALSFFLSSDPSYSLAERTVRDEIYGSCNPKEATQRLNWLASLGIDAEAQRTRLSYGLQKIIAFCTLPDEMIMVILDEPFANLSANLQRNISQKILEKVRNGQWKSVVITTNRPLDTIAALRLGTL